MIWLALLHHLRLCNKRVLGYRCHGRDSIASASRSHHANRPGTGEVPGLFG